MAPGDYHLGPSERLNERISRSWNRLVGLWASFAPSLAKMDGDGEAGTGPTRERWLLPLFTELDFGRLQSAKAEEIDGKSFPVSHRWGSQLPIHLVGAGVDLDHRSAGVAGAAKVSPHGLIQERLNRTGALWGIVSNGRLLRLLRDNATLTRQAYVEFDLEAMMSGEVYADFALLFLLLHESRFEAEQPAECVLERWVQAAQAQGTRVREQLRTGVEKAIETLGAGFLAHSANAPLREKLRTGDLSTQDYYRQLLRLVYRLIFLFVAEDRDLLHPPGVPDEARSTYHSYYSTNRLRNFAERRRGTRHPDLFELVKVVTTALGRDDGAAALGLPFLGSYLFSPNACLDLDTSSLANIDLLGAVRALAFTIEENVLRPVDYRNLGSEELGSVYESLLELHPQIDAEAAAFSLTTAAGNERKTTGSYYTPTPLISALLDSALDPVLAEAASGPDPEPALLGLKVLDPACGSGHFLVAAAHRIARKLAAVRTGEDESSPAPYRTALRDVISRCVYGIDVNPMAVELCKVSLWMEAVEPGKPLSFLDHHIVWGNSLLGTTPKLLAGGIPDEAFAALEGDDKKVVSELKKRNRHERKGQQLFDLGGSPADLMRPVAEAVDVLEHLPADSSQGLHEKELRWSQVERSKELAHARLLADAWCAAFVIRKEKGAPAITDGVLRLLSADASAGGQALHDEIVSLASSFGFLHPHLAFPGVFRVPPAGQTPDNPVSGWSGGFAIVTGNPPWDQVELQERQWFATRAPDIANAPTAARRKWLIGQLEQSGDPLYVEYREALRHIDGVRGFLSASGRYPLAGRGRINTYSVFTESASHCIRPTGRVGLIVPSGVATDDTTRYLFSVLVDSGCIVSLFEFLNEGFFADAGQGHMNRFCLLTLCDRTHPVTNSLLMFQGRALVEMADPERVFSLSRSDFELLNPNTRTCPIFRTHHDADITRSIYGRLPILQRNEPPFDPWHLYLKQGLFNATTDSGLFKTRYELLDLGAEFRGHLFEVSSNQWVPVYEAKMIQQFDHRYGDYALLQPGARSHVLPDVPNTSHGSPEYMVQPRFWVERRHVAERMPEGWKHPFLLGWRDVTDGRASARTTIASFLPPVAAEGGILLAFPKVAVRDIAALLACWNSFAFDYVSRQKVGGIHLKFFVMRQLPVPSPQLLTTATAWSECSPSEWLAQRVLELTYTSWDMAGLARELGYEGAPFGWNIDRRRQLRAELDAGCFHLFGLNRGDTEYVLESFPIVRRRDEAAHGEYLTKRLILESYDRMSAAGRS